MKRLLPTILLPAILLLGGCAGRSLDFSIDNPTDAAIALRIDDASYQIPAHQAQDIALKPGEHRMDSSWTGQIKFIVYSGGKGGLINPTLSDYVIANEIYVTEASKLQNFGALNDTIVLDGVPYQGPFVLQHGLFIDNDWRFGVREPFPDSLRGYDSGNGGNIFSKIFTAKDFVAYAQRRYDQPAPAPQTPAAAPRHLAVTPVVLPVFADAGLQAASQPLRGLYEHYRHATDPAEQQRLQKQSFQLSMDFTNACASRCSSAGVAESQKYNDFVTLQGKQMGASALVEY